MSRPLLAPGEALRWYRGPLDGSLQPYRVYLPLRRRRRYPVVVCLHGFGGRMVDWSPPARHLADALGLVLLAPDGRGNQNWDGVGEDDVFAALDDLAADVPLDPDRLTVQGGSMGGHGALRLALRYPHRFAAVSAVAGWVSAEQFYPKWYAPPGELAPPEPIAHLVEAAAPGAWRENAERLAGRLAFGTRDDVNEPEDTEWLIAWLRRQGWYGPGGWQAVRVADGGHGAGHDWVRELWFLARRRRRWPRRQLSWTLRHADGGWYRAEWRPDPLAPVRFAVDKRPDGLHLTAENAGAVTLTPALGPRPRRRLAVTVAGAGRVEVAAGESVTVPLATAPVSYVKRRGLDGPIGEFFRAPFEVVAPASGPEHEAALRLCADWNAWCLLRWTGGEPPGRDWWRPPYPWPPGAWVPPETPLLAPKTTSERDDVGLVLFGSPDELPLVRRLADWPDQLPFRPLRDGLLVGERRYEGARIGYLALHPIPWRPDRLLLLARGYPHSGIDATSWPPGALGKDLERLPWQFPDVVVWDREVVCRETVQPPLRHLPDAWLCAATLGPGWDWSGAPLWMAD